MNTHVQKSALIPPNDPNALDARNESIRATRIFALDAIKGPRVGDYVIFPRGIVRRISYHWGDTVQTSSGGSWYLGEGFVSFSGGLFGSVPLETLVRLDERRDGAVWFFRDDWARAHNGIETRIPFRVYVCSVEAPQ